MITMRELNKFNSTDNSDHESNLLVLLGKINQVRKAYGKPMTVTSGYRTKEDHLRIYRQIATRKGIKFDPSKVPMASRHLSGQAVDIYDPKGEFKQWIRMNIELFEELGLYLEDFNHTPTWVHIQITPPRSGKRFFIP